MTLDNTNSTMYFEMVQDSLSKVDKLVYIDNYKFWTYQFNPHNLSLFQFHIPSNPSAALNYTLGESKMTPLIIDEESQCISGVLSDGSYCDLIDESRSTEVRFVCSDDSNKIELLSVKEHSTCQYIAQINIPKLCQFEFFKKYNNINLVSCYKIIDEDASSFDDEVQNVNLVEYPKITQFGKGLFVGESNDEIVIVNTYSTIGDLTDRLINSIFDLVLNLNNNDNSGPSTTTEITNQVILSNQVLNLKFNVFNSFGEYIVTFHYRILKDSLSEIAKNSGSVFVEFNMIDFKKFAKKDSIYFSPYQDIRKDFEDNEPDELNIAKTEVKEEQNEILPDESEVTAEETREIMTQKEQDEQRNGESHEQTTIPTHDEL